MNISSFARRFTTQSGIAQLMEDLGNAMAGDGDILMLGGGNPSHIPEVQQFFFERMQRILQSPTEFTHIIGDYDPPQGEKSFLKAMANLLKQEYGWAISERNIALTSGSQAAFFMLFNSFAGLFPDGEKKQVLFPMAPEYIGYSDVGLTDEMFICRRPTIEILDDRFFKYHVDFSALQIDQHIGVMCVSRPTNPTGNVLTDSEVEQLLGLATQHDIPLIIDNAYGAPFPNIIFTEVCPVWGDQIILCMSLSKLGLPGARTGILIASEEIIEIISRMNAVFNLAQSSFGPALAYDLVNSGEVIPLCQNIIRPYYEEKAHQAIQWFHEALDGLDYYIHVPEGAIFLWLWFRDLPISCEALYQKLKAKGVLIIAGHHFFPGLAQDWQHKHECIRVTYSQDPATVKEAINIIATEVKQLYGD